MSVLSALEICSWRPPDKTLSLWSDLSSEPGAHTNHRLRMVFKHATHTVFSASHIVHTAYFFSCSCHFASFCLLQTYIHLPSFLQVRLGGGMPLDSHTRVMRLPSITVRGDTSSEPRILGETVITTGHQKEALTSHSSYMLVHFTEVKNQSSKTKHCRGITVCEIKIKIKCK